MADGTTLSRTTGATDAKAAPAGARITYILKDGTRREVAVPYGYSVMEGARRHGIPGIEGDCGGACACATCHVYLEDGWADRLPLADELERGMLDFAFDVKTTSRLSCQIKVDDAVDGLVVRIPERQY
ncbi:MAG TPA: 2Fe-2S iron-sulfur cluster-binding protein [Caulobacteraceae bacterium]|nr:2Fe-2S iron-sulfur cluster-binding protein [Caulobacteraceae bacterium]